MPKKILTGKIISDKMQKTVVVSVDVSKRHPIYKKIVRKNKKFKARNETEAVLGNIVKIEETKPYSKEVTWKVIEIVEKGSLGK